MTRQLKHVFSPSGDWIVLYLDDEKVWEGHDCDSNALTALTNKLDIGYKFYEFTDEDEIDGCTPDLFSSIRGIKSFD